MDIPFFHFLLHLLLLIPTINSLDFIFNSFNTTTKNLTLTNDTRIESPVIRMTNDSNQFSLGRFFYPSKIPITSFSTSFIFSILPQNPNSPGFGLAFFLCNTSSPPGAIASQYFGLFTNAVIPTVFPLIAVEFDTGRNPEFNDHDNNHIGIDLNNIESKKQTPAGYYNSTGKFESVQMNSGENVRAWIEFDGKSFEINVTVAPIGVSKPLKPTLSYKDPNISNYLSPEMFVGFSASKTNWIEAQRVLAWSFSDSGTAKELNTTNLPVFKRGSSNSLSGKAIAGIVVGCFVLVCFSLFVLYFVWCKRRRNEEDDDDVEEWEMEYWPHRFSYEELCIATKDFHNEKLIGYLAPEIANVAAPTSASDVYSFGVVLLEVACGRRPLEAMVVDEEVVLIDWVRELYARGCVVEAADSRMKGEYDVGDMEMVLKLGLACCHPEPNRRPTMKEVVALLLGEDVADAPGKVLSDLARGDDNGGGGGELDEEAPLQSSSPI
ncbi:hypothetical protein TSUD_155710 [Trifolium subterraneum]|uniref:non-specific serine/threonine protein kinase n=1 Tax=Trifolium subterraneum TaxID=3900 RepID=A0A2Z6MUQ8_TRISU|nr:hypothetical protein TSUD_155710 [Trifolium subterraneum]